MYEAEREIMNTMRMVALGLMVLAGTAGAQQPQPGRAQAMGAMHAGLFRGIQLSDAEREKVRQVHERYRPRMEQAMQASRAANEATMRQMREARERGDTAAMRTLRTGATTRMASMQPLMDSLRADLRASLTAEHQQRFDANVASMANRMARAGGRPATPRAARAMRPARPGVGRSGRAPRAPRALATRGARLELSEAERTRVKQVTEKYRPRMEATRRAMAPEARSLREARQRNDTTAARVSIQKLAQHRATMSALMEQRRVEARAALDVRTRQKMDSLRTRRGPGR